MKNIDQGVKESLSQLTVLLIKDGRQMQKAIDEVYGVYLRSEEKIKVIKEDL